jgi:hypothetical protein
VKLVGDVAGDITKTINHVIVAISGHVFKDCKISSYSLPNGLHTVQVRRHFLILPGKAFLRIVEK